jgi:hypothetical protein
MAVAREGLGEAQVSITMSELLLSQPATYLYPLTLLLMLSWAAWTRPIYTEKRGKSRCSFPQRWHYPSWTSRGPKERIQSRSADSFRLLHFRADESHPCLE